MPGRNKCESGCTCGGHRAITCAEGCTCKRHQRSLCEDGCTCTRHPSGKPFKRNPFDDSLENDGKKYIYALLDTDRKIRYIGTATSIKKRVYIHWAHRNSPSRWERNPALQAWLCSLREPPEAIVLQIVQKGVAFKAETYWISLMREVPTVALLNKNITPWGNENKSYDHLIGRTVSQATREKLSAARKGKRLNEEQRARISAAGMGRVLSEETKDKIRRKALERARSKREENKSDG
jgi:hypothetical protein